MKLRKLFTSQSAKIAKGASMGIEGLILYLAPAMSAGLGFSVCPWATAGCIRVCLGETSGRMVMDNARKARAWRTQLMRHDAPAFWSALRSEIGALSRKAAKLGSVACVRLDGTSDLGLAKMLQREFPSVLFYDYTKSLHRMLEWLDTRDSGNVPTNRWLTFSRSETNDAEASLVLSRGGDVAVVFSTKRGEALPAYASIPGSTKLYRVIDGDKHDWRFLDANETRTNGEGIIVGLRAKGAARKDASGFVVRVA